MEAFGGNPVPIPVSTIGLTWTDPTHSMANSVTKKLKKLMFIILVYQHMQK